MSPPVTLDGFLSGVHHTHELDLVAHVQHRLEALRHELVVFGDQDLEAHGAIAPGRIASRRVP